MNRIKDLRVARGETLKQMADRLGVPKTTLRSWEVGERNISLGRIISICKEYGVPLATIAPDLWQEIMSVTPTDVLQEEKEKDKC
ncbi:helix-turn-helix domain-containing protein [Ligilactobacillus saerimneri]|uniref:helix-turn-helix domain-containing protein n=1 Tax=Ligilactobacillus saerimneri TaxID=228229 RepID=UPI0024BADD27|nr:helix-turn-helix transcriptional regulator [Ligilactobacillus saerimneri]